MPPTPIPVTILTGFLGSGKTTVILNLISQLPPTYRLALLKNELGDVAIDSQIASSRSIAGVQELLNGCICCNLVGQLGDALETLRTDVEPDRIVIETSGSAFPATLAMEINRLARETGKYILDGVVVVIDVENWKGYDDTSYTARIQARYTDLVVWNKWEDAGERRLDECMDRLGDLEVDVASVKSDRGKVSKEALLGLDRRLVGTQRLAGSKEVETKPTHIDLDHEHTDNHSSEVDVLSITLTPGAGAVERSETGLVVDVGKLEELLKTAPKDEVYRIKAILRADHLPASSDGSTTPSASSSMMNGFKDASLPITCILNWAFGRWTFFEVSSTSAENGTISSERNLAQPDGRVDRMTDRKEPVLTMTVVLARGEAGKWKKRIEQHGFIKLRDQNEGALTVIVK